MTAALLRPAEPEELAELRALARPLRGAGDLDELVARAARARVVLLGEASHGTAEYYRWRSAITKRLIREHGFSFVAVEGDWPDCFAVNRWLKGRYLPERTAHDVLQRFRRWPTWMWANDEVARFASWLRHHNRAGAADVGFYGLDVYSLWDSMRVVMNYLRRDHPDSVEQAEAAYRCFEPFGEDPNRYGLAATRMVPQSCEKEAVRLLCEVRRQAGTVDSDPEAGLDASQNAEVVAGAERYYRTMVAADGSSWNVRDTHMADVLDRLLAHHGGGARAVVWAHNTHVGDARATDMAAHGMVNVGQLMRERHGIDNTMAVGFAGDRGSVVAADAWGAPMCTIRVPSAIAGSHEQLLRQVASRPSVLVFPPEREGPWLSNRRPQRAIGVVYRPAYEQAGNWVPTVMGARYDALCSFDDTTPLHPIPVVVPVSDTEHETFPWGG